MNEQERSELGRLKDRHARLEAELSSLSRELRSLEHRITTALPSPAAECESAPISTAVPPIIGQVPVQTRKATEPSTPPTIAPSPIPSPSPLPESSETATPKPEFPRYAAASGNRPQRGSLEMRVGTFWLVRVGIVMLLTGLVFFGNYAYQNFIVHLNALGKVSLLYAASAVLLGAGWRLQRKHVAISLQNYAEVLFAGGLAALYFTTYAAHHFQNLKIIESPVLDGLLLLVCAGLMVFIADRKKSEVLAVFAILLAYYTSVITRVGSFTLYSNVVLTAASIFFLLRNRWVGLTFASLVATYAAYAFWRFLGEDGWRWASASEGLWQGAWFLIAYWLLFTAAVFLSEDRKLANENRATFLTANNGAFFTLFLLTMLRVQHGGFWKFALIYGSALVVLAQAARLRLRDEPLARNAYLTQGLLLITVGLVTKYSGMHLGLLLGAESIILLMLSQASKNFILLVGAYVTAAMAVGWGIDGMQVVDRPALIWGVTLGFFMLLNSWLVHRGSPDLHTLRAAPGYFAVLALIVWFVVTYDNVAREHLPLVLGVEGIAFTLSIHLLRIREITLLGQGFIVLAQLVWIAEFGSHRGNFPPWWNPAILIAELLISSHWWQRQKVLVLPSQSDNALQAIFALGLVAILYFWIQPLAGPDAWIAFSSLLALGLTVYGVATRAWFVAAFGQIFLLISVIQFVWQVSEANPGWKLPIAPIACLALLSLSTVAWFRKLPDPSGRYSRPLLQAATIYRWTALLMSIWWVMKYIPERERIWLLAFAGVSVFLWSGWKKNREAILASAVYTGSALVLFWIPLAEAERVYLPNLIAIVALLAQRQLARRLPDRYPIEPGIHSAVIVVGGLSLWLFLTRWVLETASGFYLTASWSVFALVLFILGMTLRERVYRWLGLGVLLCSLGRVVIFDVWKLETLYRILSFMALGIVLLVLGFIYNKYQEKIREWL